jgi:hypothetical protein
MESIMNPARFNRLDCRLGIFYPTLHFNVNAQRESYFYAHNVCLG